MSLSGAEVVKGLRPCLLYKGFAGIAILAEPLVQVQIMPTGGIFQLI